MVSRSCRARPPPERVQQRGHDDAETALSSIDGANTVASGVSSGDDWLPMAADTAFEAGYRTALFVVARITAITATVVSLRLRQREV